MKYLAFAAILTLSSASFALANDMPPMQDNAMKAHAGMMMKMLDTNGDNVVSWEESQAFNKKMFDEKDANHDGKITQEEADIFHKARREEMRKRMCEQMNEKQ